MPPGRPAKPTAVKVLEGTYRPDRALSNEVQPDLLAQIPEPPEGLGEWGVREWHVVCRWLHDTGNLAATDLSLIAAYCNEVSNYWEYDAQVKSKGAVVAIKNKDGLVVRVQKNPFTALRKDSLDAALKLATQFGFTPSARTRLTMGAIPDKPKSKMAQLMNRK
ncbi:phage terminase small subunit P27 family [Spirosoma endbachense]|uniref:Phage terminase small subunit P27 family n=1 Tax=Spirosoma endbachense TaxID=2666025 RepID=A0A6P1W4G2_9BACT|nr:phage terminase small subunit P27 family [Spirosoma endbachense]QHV99212.1 phage terminase small subunit P27 family [Spirosoma endbachense]